jgi:hypothetical protein
MSAKVLKTEPLVPLPPQSFPAHLFPQDAHMLTIELPASK